jgi:hypothetical protein
MARLQMVSILTQNNSNHSMWPRVVFSMALGPLLTSVTPKRDGERADGVGGRCMGPRLVKIA